MYMYMCVWLGGTGGDGLVDVKKGRLAAALAARHHIMPCALAAWHGHAGEMIQTEHKKTSKNCFFSLKTDKIYSKFE
jgi:hypothetical protein